MHLPREQSSRAFTLIELLCVMTIILILVSLSLGPVMRAFKRAQNLGWENDSTQLADQFRERMMMHFGSAPKYPAFSLEQMFEAGLIDYRLRTFLKDKRVQFIPFSSESPDQTEILHVSISRKRWISVFKRDIKPPKE